MPFFSLFSTLFDFSLAAQGSEPEVQEGSSVLDVSMPRVADLLADEGLIEPELPADHDPSPMDITRDPNPHIGFGAGIHFCLGGPLARLEMGIALPKLVKAFPDMKIASEPLRRPTFVLRGYEKVEISS